MAKHFSPEEDDLAAETRSQEQKKSQRLLLLLLLLLIILFAYLYFFTGLIRPRPQGAPEQKAGNETAVVKKPLPPRLAQQEGQPTPAGPAPAPAGGAPAAPQKVAQGEKGAVAPEAKGAKGAKPAGQEAKPTGHEAKPAAAAPKVAAQGKPSLTEPKGGKPEGKPGKPGAAEAKGKAAAPAGETKHAKAPAAGKVKPAAAEGKGAGKAAAQAEPAGKHPSAKAKGTQAAQAKGAAKAAPAYALEIKGDLAQSEIAPVTAKLKQAGVTQVVKTKSQKTEAMHRLYLADFANHDEAQEELERLKLAAPEAFMLKENGRYAIYGGSYLRESKAAAEQERLYSKGVKLLMKTATVAVPVVKMRAGAFADKGSAAKAAERLKKAGVEATVVKAGK